MIDYINLSIGTAALAISILGLIQVLISRYLEKEAKTFFTALFGVMVACAAANLTGQYLGMYRGPIFARLFRITLFLESFFPSLILLLLTMFLLQSSGETDWKRIPSSLP